LHAQQPLWRNAMRRRLCVTMPEPGAGPASEAPATALRTRRAARRVDCPRKHQGANSRFTFALDGPLAPAAHALGALCPRGGRQNKHLPSSCGPRDATGRGPHKQQGAQCREAWGRPARRRGPPRPQCASSRPGGPLVWSVAESREVFPFFHERGMAGNGKAAYSFSQGF